MKSSRLPLCTSDAGNDCFLSFPDNTTADMVGHGVYEFASTAPVTFVNDTTSPEIVQFISFNLSSGVAVVEFSETVRVLTLQVEFISLLSLHDRPIQTYNLTGGTPLSADNSNIVAFTIDPLDLFDIKDREHICTYRGNCYITVTEDAIMDMSGNQVLPIERVIPGRIVNDLFADSISPELVSFSFDLNNGTISLTFTEPISIDSVSLTEITFEDQLINDTANYTLTGGVATLPEPAVVLIELSNNDLNMLKSQSIATNASNTFISVTENLVQDRSMNSLVETHTRVTNHNGDSSPPVLMQYSLNLQLRELTLTFDETSECRIH